MAKSAVSDQTSFQQFGLDLHCFALACLKSHWRQNSTHDDSVESFIITFPSSQYDTDQICLKCIFLIKTIYLRHILRQFCFSSKGSIFHKNRHFIIDILLSKKGLIN